MHHGKIVQLFISSLNSGGREGSSKKSFMYLVMGKEYGTGPKILIFDFFERGFFIATIVLFTLANRYPAHKVTASIDAFNGKQPNSLRQVISQNLINPSLLEDIKYLSLLLFVKQVICSVCPLSTASWISRSMLQIMIVESEDPDMI